MNTGVKATIAIGAALVLLPVVVIALFVGSQVPAAGACGPAAAQAGAVAPGGVSEQLGGDGTPSIMGAPVLPAGSMRTWYESHPSYAMTVGPDAVPIAEVIGLYYLVGQGEGVRGDLAFIQAVHETGGFTNSDARLINNFAGVAHYDDLSISGTGWATAQAGVTGHIQLLKRYALGNQTPLALPDQSVTAGATAATFGALAGTWASDPNYWASLARLYTQAGGQITDVALCPPTPVAVAAVDAGSGPVAIDYVQGVPVNAAVKPQVEAMVAAADAEGVQLRLGNSYRSVDRQIVLRRNNCGSSQYAIYEMPSGQCSPPTAKPGTSQHQQGLAIDFSNCNTRSTACYRWLTANAARFGYYNLPSEAWHWSTTGR